MRTHFSVNLRLTNHKLRILIAGGTNFNQAILKCYVDHHNGTQNHLYIAFK